MRNEASTYDLARLVSRVSLKGGEATKLERGIWRKPGEYLFADYRDTYMDINNKEIYYAIYKIEGVDVECEGFGYYDHSIISKYYLQHSEIEQQFKLAGFWVMKHKLTVDTKRISDEEIAISQGMDVMLISPAELDYLHKTYFN